MRPPEKISIQKLELCGVRGVVPNVEGRISHTRNRLD